MTRKAIYCAATAVLTLGVLSSAMARPNYLGAFKQYHKTAEGKPKLNAANCGLCHIGRPNAGKWNPYGEALRKALGAEGVTDNAKIVAALKTAGDEKNAAGQTFVSLINQDQMPGAAAGGTVQPGAGVQGTWQYLFNGRNMDGLHKMNAGDWKVENGLLRYTGGGNGWLRSNDQYTNYALVVVWRYAAPGTGQNNDAGVFLKAGMEGNPWPNSPQLNMGPTQNYGSIGGAQGTRARFDLIKPDGWNSFAITVTGDKATLAINGQSAWDMATGLPTGAGFIGIENEGRPFDIAQIAIMPLP